MNPLFLRIVTTGSLYVYNRREDALAAAGASDRVLEIVNPAAQLIATVSGGVITLQSYDGSKRHVQVVK